MEFLILMVIIGIIFFYYKNKKNKPLKMKSIIKDKQSNITNEAEKIIYCPYCNIEFKKAPSRKTKCKSCGNYVYVRTDYKTEKKIFLTVAQLEIYEKKAKKHYDKTDIERRLLEPFEKELNDGEEIRDILNKYLSTAKEEWQWGMYRNITSKIGDLNYLEDKKLDALKCSLEVIYYDVNNPNNVGRFAIENNLQEEYPAFSPFDLSVVNSSSYWIKKIASDSKELNIKDIESLFIEHNTIKYKELIVIPNKPEVIWNMIKNNFDNNLL